MQPYDMIMLLVLAAATAFGLWKGFAWQVASLSSIFLSYFVAVQFRHQLASMIDAAPPFNMFLAMLILFLGTSLAVWIGFRIISGAIEKMKLKEFDRQVGALLGVVKGGVLCIIITLFAVTLMDEGNQRAIVNSRSGYYIAIVLDRAHAIMPDEVHDVLGPYIHSLDNADDGRGDHLHAHGDDRTHHEHDHGLGGLPMLNVR